MEETLIFKIRQQSIQSCCRVRTFAQYYLRKNHHHPLCNQHHEQAGGSYQLEIIVLCDIVSIPTLQ